jgi:hypothetical protein
VYSLVEISVQDNPMAGLLEAGLGQERGFICFMLPESGWTKGDPTLPGSVTHDFARNAREVPVSADCRGACGAKGFCVEKVRTGRDRHD